jgi:hypothetical protein
MYLDVVSASRLTASTVDDIEGTLYKFIPSGMVHLLLSFYFYFVPAVLHRAFFCFEPSELIG